MNVFIVLQITLTIVTGANSEILFNCNKSTHTKKYLQVGGGMHPPHPPWIRHWMQAKPLYPHQTEH